MPSPVWTQPQASSKHFHARKQLGKPLLSAAPNSVLVLSMGDKGSHFTNINVQNRAEDCQVLSAYIITTQLGLG